MAFLKRKNSESTPVKARPLQELVTERVLTAEGWQRRSIADEAAAKGKKK